MNSRTNKTLLKEDKRKKKQVDKLIDKCKTCKKYEKNNAKCTKYNSKPLYALLSCKYKYYKSL